MNKNIGKRQQSRSLDFCMPWEKLKFNLRVDHTNSIIKSQDFGETETGFVLIRTHQSVAIETLAVFNLQTVHTCKHEATICLQWSVMIALYFAVQRSIHCPLGKTAAISFCFYYLLLFFVCKFLMLVFLFPTFFTWSLTYIQINNKY